MTLSSLLSVCCCIFEEGLDFLMKTNNKLTCTESLIVKLSTAILLLVESEPFACLRKLDLSKIFLVLLVPFFDLKLSEMFQFCRICARFKTLEKGRRWKHFNLRVQGLPLTINGAYDKLDA